MKKETEDGKLARQSMMEGKRGEMLYEGIQIEMKERIQVLVVKKDSLFSS